MQKRKITKINKIKFQPFNNYKVKVKGLSWHKITYSKSNGGFGSYVLKMNPGSKTLSHLHPGFEEFLVIKGQLTDSDGKVFKKGDFIHLNLVANIRRIQKKVVSY
jgi:anti-sigma factor ChrR (cupin superfamily)